MFRIYISGYKSVPTELNHVQALPENILVFIDPSATRIRPKFQFISYLVPDFLKPLSFMFREPDKEHSR